MHIGTRKFLRSTDIASAEDGMVALQQPKARGFGVICVSVTFSLETGQGHGSSIFEASRGCPLLYMCVEGVGGGPCGHL